MGENGAVIIPTFRDVHDQVGRILREQGCLAVVLVDLAPLAHIERSFGGAAFQSLHSQIEPLFEEMKDRFRQGDLLTSSAGAARARSRSWPPTSASSRTASRTSSPPAWAASRCRTSVSGR